MLIVALLDEFLSPTTSPTLLAVLKGAVSGPPLRREIEVALNPLPQTFFTSKQTHCGYSFHKN